MAARYRVSREARADLAEVFSYIAEDSVTAARRMNARFYEAFTTLARMPGIGRERPELDSGTRSFPVGNYIIYYRERAQCIEISRVLHGMREQGRALGL
jgi:toxin ParE1/3/4